MKQHISHDFTDESLDAKARWFQTLTLSERMDLLCELTDLVLENNPNVVKVGRAQSSTERLQILSIS